jgi:peptidoglycan biosynthesis protein MviN/MurJ (putative lipid II flippase)
MVEFTYNFWENMTFLLGGVVVAGILAAIAQIITLRMINNTSTKLRINSKKVSEDGIKAEDN